MHSPATIGPRLAVVLGIVLVAVLGAPALADQVRALEIRSQRVLEDGSLQLFAAFMTGDRGYVTNVDPAKLRVEYEDDLLDVERETVRFAYSGQGMGVVIAIDVSTSMEEALPEIRENAAGFAREMRPGVDRVALGKIDDEWELLLDFTGDSELVARSIERLKLSRRSLTTALFASIYQATEMLRLRARDLPARRMVIVISDGQNKMKGRTAAECIDNARAAHVDIHSLICIPERTEELMRAKGELEKISMDTGGFTKTAYTHDRIEVGFKALRQRLMDETVITLSGDALPRDGREHELELAYGDARAAVRFRAARIDPAPLAPAEPEEETSEEPATPAAEEPAEDEPEAPADDRLLWIAGLAALALLLIVSLAIGLGRRARRRREAEQALQAEAHRRELQAREAEVERLRQEQSAAQSAAAEPAVAPPSAEPAPQPPPAAPPKRSAAQRRKTEYRPPGPEPGQVSQAPATRGMRAVGGLAREEFVPFPTSGGKIGYDLSNDVVLEADSVSGSHAELVPMGGGFGIRDLDSTNGTFVDGERVSTTPVALAAGSEVRLGRVVLICE